MHLHLLWTCGAGSRGSATLPAERHRLIKSQNPRLVRREAPSRRATIAITIAGTIDGAGVGRDALPRVRRSTSRRLFLPLLRTGLPHWLPLFMHLHLLWTCGDGSRGSATLPLRRFARERDPTGPSANQINAHRPSEAFRLPLGAKRVIVENRHGASALPDHRRIRHSFPPGRLRRHLQ